MIKRTTGACLFHFSRIEIDMVHHFPDLFFPIFILWMIFRYDIIDKFVVPFAVAFLICIHRITIEYIALDLSCLHIYFDFFVIAEFTSRSVIMTWKSIRNFSFPCNFPQPAEYFCYESCYVAFSQEHKLQVTFGK